MVPGLRIGPLRYVVQTSIYYSTRLVHARPRRKSPGSRAAYATASVTIGFATEAGGPEARFERATVSTKKPRHWALDA